MKKTLFVICLLPLLIFSSCGKKTNKKNNEPPVQPAVTEKTSTPPAEVQPPTETQEDTANVQTYLEKAEEAKEKLKQKLAEQKK